MEHSFCHCKFDTKVLIQLQSGRSRLYNFGVVGPLFIDFQSCYGRYCAAATKKKSYKGNRLRDSWLTGMTRSAGTCNLVTLSTNFSQYKNFLWLSPFSIYRNLAQALVALPPTAALILVLLTITTSLIQTSFKLNQGLE